MRSGKNPLAFGHIAQEFVATIGNTMTTSDRMGKGLKSRGVARDVRCEQNGEPCDGENSKNCGPCKIET